MNGHNASNGNGAANGSNNGGSTSNNVAPFTADRLAPYSDQNSNNDGTTYSDLTDLANTRAGLSEPHFLWRVTNAQVRCLGISY